MPYLFQSSLFVFLGGRLWDDIQIIIVLFIKNHPTRIHFITTIMSAALTSSTFVGAKVSVAKTTTVSKRAAFSVQASGAGPKRVRIPSRDFFLFFYAYSILLAPDDVFEQINLVTEKRTKKERGFLSRPPTRARGLDAFEDIRFARIAPRRVLARVACRGSTPCTLERATEFEKYYLFLSFFDTLVLIEEDKRRSHHCGRTKGRGRISSRDSFPDRTTRKP